MIEALPKRIHCLGAGGAGMLPLALFLADSGHELTAEDDAFSERAKDLLLSKGVKLQAFEEDDSVAFVYSSAVGVDHPGRVFARKAGCVAMRRGECLAVIARERKLVAVAGSHGKTTTCGMLIDILDTAGFKFDYLLGAQFEAGAPYRSAGEEWLVAEIDESDGTIDLFSPEISVIVNLDHDHHARYETAEDYQKVFERLVQRTRACVVYDANFSATFRESASLTKAEFLSIGKDGSCSLDASRLAGGWSSLSFDGVVKLDGILINRNGAMNQLDAGFAIVAAIKAGCRVASGQLFEFRSVKRRQRCYYNSPRIQIFDDYAHHPRELDAVLEQFGKLDGWQTIVVFQPHRYSRTRMLKKEFAESLVACERLVLLDVYAASEEPLEGGAGRDLFEACVELRDGVEFVEDDSRLFQTLDELAAEGRSRVLFLGAGIGDRLALAYREHQYERDGDWAELYKSVGEVSSFETILTEEEPLASKTTLRVGGVAERYFEPESLSQLVCCLQACKRSGIQISIIGRGSNLVVADRGVKGLVVRLSHPIWSRFELLGKGRVRVGAGMRIKALCASACKAGLVGFEFLEGIPGCVGGVLRMNAGAMGGWVFDLVESIRYVTSSGELIEAKKDELDFGYRYCRELKDAFAIDAVFRGNGSEAPQESIRRTIDTYQNRRKESQPREPSAGCIFKNPEGDSAGRLIDELGLKGAVVGGAEVSQTHGNFIINRGGATSMDVIELVKLIRRVARERKGVELEPEVLLFGSDWQEALR